jgi:4-phospho-D-threonate 3-dehydrogenase / 4-phospho-D-erythronate 3-dehydrogenase
MGDPAGIGPEVVLKAVAEEEIKRVCVPVIIGDAQLLAHTARTLDLQSGYDIIRTGESFPDPLSEPVIYHLDNISGLIEPGIESGAAGKAAANYIEAAVELCAAGNIDAIATAPINKRAHRRRGICDGVCGGQPAHRFTIDACSPRGSDSPRRT